MMSMLEVQFKTCAAENSKINADFIDTDTTDSCENGNVFENLLSGKDGCMFTDPEKVTEL